ncbi:MAG: MerR family transcriptional regulator [Polyangia bacterium]
MREVQLHSGIATGATTSGSAAGACTLEKPLRVGELAKRTGKTVRALHLYEEMGLVHPVHRSKGGFRLYAPSSVARVQWIGKLKDAGFSLVELRDFLRSVGPEGVIAESTTTAATAMRRVRDVFAERLGEIRAQISRLVQLEGDLVESLEYLEACRSCERTEQLGCGTCCEPAHAGKAQPLLVAGIQRG